MSVTNVENLNGSDFAAGSVSNDTLTLLNDVSGLSVNLANGINTLNLAAGANSFTNIFSVDTINGTASDDTLTVATDSSRPTTTCRSTSGPATTRSPFGSQFVNAALHNVEHLVGSGRRRLLHADQRPERPDRRPRRRQQRPADRRRRQHAQR